MKRFFHGICLIVLIFAGAAQAADKPAVEFRDGDHIAFIGNEFFERDMDRGYIETELTTRFPDKNLTFRNLGYSGDTVFADARNLCSGWAVFGPADQGFDRLKNLVEHIKPTLIFVAYGMNESFDGEKGIDPFVNGLNRMLDMLAAASAPDVRFVLVSPIRHEDLGRPLPDPAEHNKNIELYIAAMEKVAQQRNCGFINLFEALGDGTKDKWHTPFTIDGIHLTPYGYWRAAGVIEKTCGYEDRNWTAGINAKDGKTTSTGTKIDSVKVDGKTVQFNATDDFLPLAPAPVGTPKELIASPDFWPVGNRSLTVANLPAGTYSLQIDGQPIATTTAEALAKGIALSAGPQEQQEEQLRKTIVAKNFDFFNFWRPDNDTYIFGYRKHEQGKNAVEIPQFEPLVEAKEAKIAELRKPIAHTFVISPAK